MRQGGDSPSVCATQSLEASRFFYLIHILFSALLDLSDEQRCTLFVVVLGTTHRTLALHREVWWSRRTYAGLYGQVDASDEADGGSSEKQEGKHNNRLQRNKDLWESADVLAEDYSPEELDRWAWWMEVVTEAAAKMKIPLEWLPGLDEPFIGGDASRYAPTTQEEELARRRSIRPSLSASGTVEPTTWSTSAETNHLTPFDADWDNTPLLTDHELSQNGWADDAAEEELTAEDFAYLLAQEPESEAAALLDGFLAPEQAPDTDYEDSFQVMFGLQDAATGDL